MIYLLLALLLLLAYYLLLPARNDRDWEPSLAALSWADIGDGAVTVHNIRNCEYRSTTDYTVRYYDRTFELGALRTMDLFLVDWGLPHISHAMLSFGFADGAQLCFSIEARKKRGELYSSVRAFFREYELIYVVADERDVVRLRTNYRKGEEVCLYRLKAPPQMIRQVFMDYMQGINKLKDRPKWYNALTANCTTGIWKHIVPYYPRLKMDWRIIASGHLDEMIYELGAVDTTMPLEELRRRSRINERSQAAGQGEDYSRLIRQGLPGF